MLLNELPVDVIYDGYDRDKTKFIFSSDQASHSLPLLPLTIEFSFNDDVEKHTITSYNYTDQYYSSDLETP